MKAIIRRFLPAGMVLSLLVSAPCALAAETTEEDAVHIALSDAATTVDGEQIAADSSAAVYWAEGSTIDHYEAEYAQTYGSAYGEAESADEWHTAAECNEESHIIITQPGTYVVSGTLHGQLSVKLDSKTKADRTVTLVLDGADITCDVAPAVLFEKAYEYDQTAYEDDGITITLEQAQSLAYDTAGAKVVLADGSVNNISGSHVAKCYAYTVGEDGTLTFTTKEDGSAKKRVKYDGAFYSKVSMTISGEEKGTGVLNITADNEGLDTEQHLVITGGQVNINSQDDGINTNDEQGSVTRIDGGSLTINAGLGAEGDGIDSNGYLIINGGTVFSCAKPISDSGIDADLGSVINGGSVIALGSTMDQVSKDSAQPSMMLKFSSRQQADTVMTVKDSTGESILSFAPGENDFLRENARDYGCAILSDPDMKVGETNTIYAGDTQLGYVSASEATGHGPGGDFQPPEGGNGPSGDFRPPEGGNGPGGDFRPPEGGNGPGGDFRPPEGGNNPGGDFQPPEGVEPPDFGGFGGEQGGTPSNRDFTLTALTNVFSGVAPYEEGLPFADVDAVTHKAYYDAINWACKEGITTGTSATKFSPDGSCTRAQIVTFLWRAAGEPKPASSDCAFTDVKEGDYFYEAVLWACEKGITLGATENTFAPNGTCTRKEAVTFLYRFQNSPESTAENPFRDVAAGSYYETAVRWANGEKITTGTGEGKFSPDKVCTRAQIVTFLYRMTEA